MPVRFTWGSAFVFVPLDDVATASVARISRNKVKSLMVVIAPVPCKRRLIVPLKTAVAELTVQLAFERLSTETPPSVNAEMPVRPEPSVCVAEIVPPVESALTAEKLRKTLRLLVPTPKGKCPPLPVAKEVGEAVVPNQRVKPPVVAVKKPAV